MATNPIEGVRVIPLKVISDERGSIMHMLRSDAPHFEEFGEVYFSTAYPGVVKGWHDHTRQTQNYAVVSGMIKLVLYDMRESSPTRGALMELFIGDRNYCLVTIPPGVINGYKCIGDRMAIVANCATIPHDPDEIIRYDPNGPTVPYDWDIVMR
ncbi:MAG: dTDP-4-dehydrorhamnose 3,5-epimerase family protein [Chthonomonadales bacterium]|nr:dTDP-4-dehydrorhamnose 3,5-epimerase family protein [Chthonomonadales bacterium]